jgi:hypothetical protein
VSLQGLVKQIDVSYKKESEYNFKSSLIDVKNRLEIEINKLIEGI